MEAATILLTAMAATAAQDKPPIVTLPVASPAIVQASSGPRPINAGTWVTPADYPATAIRSGAEGTVGIRLEVNASGRPTDCAIFQSSGNGDLDAATCPAVMARGRFEPARNERGETVSGTFHARVVWKIDSESRVVPQPGQMVITFTVHPDGSVTDCTFSAQGSATTPATDPCATVPNFTPSPAGSGAGSRRIRLTNRVEYLDGQ